MAEKDKNIAPAATNELQDQEAQPTEGLARQESQESQALGAVVDHTEDELEAQLAYESLRKKRAAQKRKRIIIIAAVIVIAAAVGAFFVLGGSNKDAEGPDVFAMAVPVTKGKFEATVGGSGKTEPATSGVVSPEVPGIIQDLNATVGQHVNEGDVLFTLKNDELDESVRKMQDALDTARRKFESSNNKVDYAYDARQQAWDKANDANDWSMYDQVALNSAITDAEAALQEDLAAVQVAESDLADAQKKADKRVVRAPMSGNIIAVNAQNGQAIGGAAGGTSNSSSNASSNAPLIQIADVSKMKVAVQVNEVDIENVKVGQKATVTFQALPDLILDAKVLNIATVATSSNGGSGSSDSSSGVVTYAVDLEIANEGDKIKPGMTANVSIITQEIEDALMVPTGAVLGEEEGNPHVLKVTDAENKEYDNVPVTLVAQSTSQIAIDGNVKENDLVLPMDPDAASAAGAADGAGM